LPLLPFEVANALRFNIKDPTLAIKTYEVFSRLPIDITPLSAGQLGEALVASYRFATTLYDTSYHLLAKLMGATFITCDREYFKKADSWGSIELWN